MLEVLWVFFQYIYICYPCFVFVILFVSFSQYCNVFCIFIQVVSAALPNSGQRWWVTCKKQGVLTPGSSPDSRHHSGWGVSISSVVFLFIPYVSPCSLFNCLVLVFLLCACVVTVLFVFLCYVFYVFFHLGRRVQALNTIFL